MLIRIKVVLRIFYILIYCIIEPRGTYCTRQQFRGSLSEFRVLPRQLASINHPQSTPGLRHVCCCCVLAVHPGQGHRGSTDDNCVETQSGLDSLDARETCDLYGNSCRPSSSTAVRPLVLECGYRCGGIGCPGLALSHVLLAGGRLKASRRSTRIASACSLRRARL